MHFRCRGGAGSVEILAATALTDEEPSLREDTAYALGSIGGEVAIVLLQQALADEHDFIQEAAEEVLEELSGRGSPGVENRHHHEIQEGRGE